MCGKQPIVLADMLTDVSRYPLLPQGQVDWHEDIAHVGQQSLLETAHTVDELYAAIFIVRKLCH